MFFKSIEYLMKGKHMSDSLFDKYGGVETLTPLVGSFIKELWRPQI